MLSVVVYGRNDSHGYNLHKRVALSLNCIAHVLDDPDDEIVFVDYNTPPEMPTFPEAICDTLTESTIDRLRVIRIPATLHEERYASRSNLVTVEPVARNAGIRRTNPANPWILSTNTDMVFVLNRARSLSRLVADLDAGYYALPRFEIPEALWESLDRKDPGAVLATVADWGTRLHLDEIVTADPWIGFDAPGDFQLVPRERLFAISGFDEEMLLGRHRDSNLGRRLWLDSGEPLDLSLELRGYHCDHTRVAGVRDAHGTVANDLDHFVHGVERSGLPAQTETWGLAGVTLEELDLRATTALALPAALRAVLPEPSGPPLVVDPHAGPGRFSYDAAHVLPFVASALTMLPLTATIAYIGAHAELAGLLARLLAELRFANPLLIVDVRPGVLEPIPGTCCGIADVASDAAAVIFDFGLPAALARVADPLSVQDWPLEARQTLGLVLTHLDTLAGIDVGGTDAARPLRGYIVVNAINNVLQPHVDARVMAAASQFSTRVRHGHAIRPPPDADDDRERVVRWAVGSQVPEGQSCAYELGTYIDLTRPGYEGFVTGDWSWPEDDGTWTDGARASVLLGIPAEQLDIADHFAVDVVVRDEHVPVGSESLTVDVQVNGAHVKRWHVESGVATRTSRFELDRATLKRTHPVRVDFVVHGPTSPSAQGTGRDRRELGVKIAAVCLDAVPSVLRLGHSVDCCAPRGGGAVLWSGWSRPEAAGTWSEGNEATIRIPPVASAEGAIDLVLEFSDAYVRPLRGHPTVEAAVDGRPTASWEFATGGPHTRRLRLPASSGATTVVLTLPTATAPVEIGESADPRRLALQLRSLTISPTVG